MENKIITRRRCLEQELALVRYKIANLTHVYSPDQVRCWRKRRDSLIQSLNGLPTVEQVKASAKRFTALKKQILKPIPKRHEIRKMSGLRLDL